MDMNIRAQCYLEAFFAQSEFPGGLSFRKALSQSNLDGTMTSLDRIDYLLDQIRGKFKPQPDAFFKVHANQNFLYLLCFYVGYVLTKETGKALRWMSYQDMIDEIPDNGEMFPYCFETSATCITPFGYFFVPLNSITARLFDENVTKSVRFSVESCAGPSGWARPDA